MKNNAKIIPPPASAFARHRLVQASIYNKQNGNKDRKKVSSSSSSAASSEKMKDETDVSSLVSSIASKKQGDLDLLRSHLQSHPEAAGELQTPKRKQKEDDTNSPPHGKPAHKEPHAPPSPESHKKHPKPQKNKIPSFMLVKVVVHTILVLLFLLFAAIYCVRSIHDDYFVTLLKRSARTDEDLLHEFTYYDRRCTLADMTVTKETAHEMIAKDGTAIDQMMTHGSLIFQNMLSNATVHELRKFVEQKNIDVAGTPSEYPVSQGFRRISYGIEATEHPTVIQALKEIHDNKSLENVLEGLLGKNPAVTEITAITASLGSPDQEWHSDTKSEGNGVMYARTYAHSYSLFIPLQDTTSEMGATDVCPGSHYCADEPYTLCEQKKIRLSQVDGEYWRAGDAALLNQQVWHRGSKHTDPDALDRIVFIVSFLSRPTDTRQLGRGTYFHMKWNMWGHTWQDLGDSVNSMARPFNFLRCLHLWKPSNRDWGYDLVMSAALRIANVQNGMEPEDLFLFTAMLDRLHIPKWLQGQVLTSKDDYENVWPFFIDDMISKLLEFTMKVNVVALALYFVFTVKVATVIQYKYKRGGIPVIRNAFTRVVISLVLVAGITLWTLENVRTSEWALGISSGVTLMRPFSSTYRHDPAVSDGKTTFPEFLDVLVGTRYDAKFLGAYHRWLDFHPGNTRFLSNVNKVGGSLYRSYEKGLPPAFHETILYETLNIVNHGGGRFLQQDYRFGDWRVMNLAESLDYTQLTLRVGTSGLQYAINKEIDFLMGDYRFGVLRMSIIAEISLRYLIDLKREIFGKPERSSTSNVFSFRSNAGLATANRTVIRPLTSLPTKTGNVQPYKPLLAGSPRWHTFPLAEPKEFTVGSFVSVQSNKGIATPATICAVLDNNIYDVAFYETSAYHSGVIQQRVHGRKLKSLPSLIEGSRVSANFMGNGDWFNGRVDRVRPGGDIAIRYDDGDYEADVELDRYRVQY